MTAKELLVVIVFMAALATLVPPQVTEAHLRSPSSLTSTVEEELDQDPSTPDRRRRDSGHEGTSHLVLGVDGDGLPTWTVRRRVSTAAAGNVSDASSSTESRLTADQWRRRQRSVTTSPDLPLNAAYVCDLSGW